MQFGVDSKLQDLQALGLQAVFTCNYMYSFLLNQ